LNCGPNDKVTISTICGRDIDVSSSSSRRRHLSSDNEVNFSLILNAIAESDLRQKDALIGQYLQGSNLNNILTDIRTALSSTTTTTLSSITAMYYSFVDSVIRGLGLYYPAWGTSETCFNDGNQDDYMNNNPSLWMFTTLEDCCKRYYSWDVVKCLSSDSSFVDPTKDLFYPDWGKTNTCINDGQAPPYMKKASSVWLYTSLEDCCSRYYSWDKECTKAGGGNVPSASPKRDGWYAHYQSESCVKSCEGPSPCAGVAEIWDILYTTKEECCQQRLWWIGKECAKN